MVGVFYLLQLEHDISKFAKITGDNSTSMKFIEASKSRKVAIRSLLWNRTLGQWVDYWLDKNDSHQVFNLMFAHFPVFSIPPRFPFSDVAIIPDFYWFITRVISNKAFYLGNVLCPYDTVQST
jgi:Trehalase